MSTPRQGFFPPRPTEPTPPFDVGSTGPTMPRPPFPMPRPGGGGSAMEGLGQVDQGGRVIGTALGRAQQANQASSEAIGGGGRLGGMGGINTASADPIRSALMKKGGKVKAYAKGGSVSASSRGDGIAQRGKTKGRFI